MTPVNSGWILASGDSINERGEITGTGLVNNYFTHAFLLTPVDEDSDVNQRQRPKTSAATNKSTRNSDGSERPALGSSAQNASVLVPAERCHTLY